LNALKRRGPTIDTDAQREKVQNVSGAKKETGHVKECVAILGTLTFNLIFLKIRRLPLVASYIERIYQCSATEKVTV
jgi:hypothetical protein